MYSLCVFDQWNEDGERYDEVLVVERVEKEEGLTRCNSHNGFIRALKDGEVYVLKHDSPYWGAQGRPTEYPDLAIVPETDLFEKFPTYEEAEKERYQRALCGF